MYFLQLLWQDILRWGRRVIFAIGVVTLSMAVAGAVLWYVPLFPYSPVCSKRFFPTGTYRTVSGPYSYSSREDDMVISGTMATAFADSFTKRLDGWNGERAMSLRRPGWRDWKIRYIRIGNTVLLRFADWYSDPTNAVTNANMKALAYLADREYSPVWTDMPGEVRAMVAPLDSPFDAFDNCDLARALAIQNWGR